MGKGAGETSASGTSSCAVAYVSHRLGKVAANVEMKMPGGVLTIDIDATWQVRLCGPVEGVATMMTHI